MDSLVVGFIMSGLLFGTGAGAIASAKNRSFVGYFLLGFFFSLVGLLIAIGMPSLQVDASSDQTSVGDERERSDQVPKPDSVAPTDFPESKDAAVRYVLELKGLPRLFAQEEVERLSDGFKIFLADHYKISRHDVLGQFAFGEKLFDDLNGALAAARAKYCEETASIRQIEDSDWEQTRLAVNSGRYLREPGTRVVAERDFWSAIIALWSDGSIETTLRGDQSKAIFASLPDAIAFARTHTPYSGGDDPEDARGFLKSRGYVIDDSPLDGYATRTVKTPQGATFESRGKKEFQQLLVQLAKEELGS
jgi:hypothetical protein